MQYLDKEIRAIDKGGITMSDGYKISFAGCNQTWKRMSNAADSKCVAERDITADSPYFRFYGKDGTVELLFMRKGLLKRWRIQKAFIGLQRQIDQLGYATYDRS